MEYASEAAAKERLPKSPIKIADNRGQTLARYIHKKRGAMPVVQHGAAAASQGGE